MGELVWATIALGLAVAALLITVLRTESAATPVFRERGWVGDEFA